MKAVIAFFAALLLLGTSAVADPLQSFHLNSGAFTQGGSIPRSYTYDGGSQIPPLNWWGEPNGTQAYALLVYDQDAPQPGGTAFIHWLVYSIPEGTRDITNAIMEGAPVAPNSYGRAEWDGPAPPKGAPAHHYIFALYALDSILNFPLASTSAQILTTINGHVIAEATLMGTYQRD